MSIENMQFAISFVSFIIVIISIISPIATAHIKRSASYNLKFSELYFTAKSNAYVKFLEETAHFPHVPTQKDLIELECITSSVLLYAGGKAQNAVALYGQLLSAGISDKVDGNRLGKSRGACILALQKDLSEKCPKKF